MRRSAPLALFLLCLVIPSYAQAQVETRGYVASACDMDMNHDGTFGGSDATADCNLCDSTSGAAGAVGTEGYAEWYVDCNGGTNNGSCGSPGSPCATITYALTSRLNAADSTPDAVCFKGTCAAEPKTGIVPVSGVSPNTYSVTLGMGDGTTTNWTLPSKPSIIMGWDADNDGSYPPTDTGDTSVIDGCSAQQYYAFSMPTSGHDIELAHFTAAEQGSRSCIGQTGIANATTCSTNANCSSVFGSDWACSGTPDFKCVWLPSTGFFFANAGPKNVFIHDVKADRINYQQPLCDGQRGVSFGSSGQQWANFWEYNLNLTNIGAYWNRGGVGTTVEQGPIRISNSSYDAAGFSNDGSTAPGCNPGANNQKANYAVAFGKLWAHLTDQQWISNTADANTDVWTPIYNNTSSAVVVDACVRNVHINNNSFTEWKAGVTMKPSPSGCTDRGVQDVDIIGNYIHTSASSVYSTGKPYGVLSQQGGSSNGFDFIDTANILNNTIDLPSGGNAGLYLGDGSVAGCGRSDTWTIANNTIFADSPNRGGIYLGAADWGGTVKPCTPDFAIKDNLVVGITSAKPAFSVDSVYVANSTFSIDGNASNAVATFNWGGTTQNLATWNANTGVGTDKQCTPTFASSTDYHLASGDTCAKDAGVSTASLGVTIDADGDARSGTYDVGMDEAIASPPGSFSFVSAPYVVSEAVTPQQVCVARGGGTTGAVTVAYATSNGTATAGSDYTAASGTLSWGNGVSTDQCFNVTITNDVAAESDETINVTLSSPTGGATIAGVNPTSITIVDNEAATGTQPVAVDNTRLCLTDPVGGTVSTIPTVTITTAPAGTMLIVGAASEAPAVSPPSCQPSATTVTWKGVAMTYVTPTNGQDWMNQNSSSLCNGVWYLTKAQIDTVCISSYPCAGSVVVTTPGVVTSVDIVASQWKDMDQTGPEVARGWIHDITALSTQSDAITTATDKDVMIGFVALSDVTATYTASGQNVVLRLDHDCDTTGTHYALQTAPVAVAGSQSSGGTWVLGPKRYVQMETAWKGTQPVCTPTCGDGAKTCTEACDDGNTTNSDGCNSTCTAIEAGFLCPTPGSACVGICGDGLVRGTETCDDGNALSSDMCINCQVATCGDGFVCSSVVCTTATPTGPEQCDGANDGNCSTGCAGTCLCNTPAPVTQACCIPGTLTCSDETAANCTAGGRDPQGVSTDCAPNPCTTTTMAPEESFAYCQTDGTCQELTATQAETSGGTLQPGVHFCTPNPCAQPTPTTTFPPSPELPDCADALETACSGNCADSDEMCGYVNGVCICVLNRKVIN